MKTIIIAAILALGSSAHPCTAFRMPTANNATVVGRNFDWDFGHGLIVINKRGVAKKAFALHASDTAQWTSTYGSLTFNQAGRELPYGGLNEKGLMIEVLWLGWTAWPKTAVPSINEVQWIQYQLDQRSSVQDLIQHIDDVRILPTFAKVHFFVCDQTGECATIEGLGSKIEIHTGDSGMPLKALTNDSYTTSEKYLSSKKTCASPADGHSDGSSLDRFARAACFSQIRVAGETADAEMDRAHSYLNLVDQGEYTKWQIAYDLTDLKISIRTHESPVAKTVSLKNFDFSCKTPVKVIDINAVIPVAGDVSAQFVDYTLEANRSIVEKSLLTGFAHLPAPVVDKIVAFPDSLACITP